MKKLFTLVAFLAVVMGAKAEWVEDYKVDYSTYNGFPFYVMGFVPEWVDGVMTDLGGNYTYATIDNQDGLSSDVIVTTQGGVQYYRLPSDGTWHQYFIADGIPTELDGAYTVKALVKASEAVTINVNMGWGWGDGQQASASVTLPTEWTEVEWEYSGIGGTSCNLVAQPNTAAQIEWKWLTVSHNAKPVRPTIWQEWLTKDGQPVVDDGNPIPGYMGNAETPWEDASVRFNDQEKNYLICAWSKEKGRNMNDADGWDPFPADIEEVDGSHVFVCHGQPATTEGDASAWDNQFWIQSPKAWKSGEQVKIHFRYKASQNVGTQTQMHKQNPSDYLHWQAIGDINFTTEWQEYDGVVTIPDQANGAWSIAFNLNSSVKDAVNFYFDDLSWKSMKLDEGYFVAGTNPQTGLEYDFDNAVQFEFDSTLDIPCYTATIGEKGKPDTYVSQVMISTVRGNDAAFKGNTLKPVGEITNDPNGWLDYTQASLAKLNLPGAGVWKIYLSDEFMSMAFEMLEGDIIEKPEINPNPTVVVVNGQERDDLSDTTNSDGTVTVREGEGGTGEAWDNQFWIMANRTLSKGEVTVLQFKYKSSIPAKTTTQCHAGPGEYLHWSAIGDVNFTEEWQDFSTTFTVPGEADGMKSIAFNMAEIKEACKYEIKDVVWKTEDGMESLIKQTGAENFFVKEGAGTTPHMFDDGTGISNVANTVNVPTVTYNIAGQRVNNNYKGLVIKNGKKVVVK